MKVAIFGATGLTGIQLVKRALNAGHEVTAFVREPCALRVSHELLRVVKADALDASSIRSALKGTEAVISALGTRNRRKPTTIYSEGTGNIIKVMKEHGIKRILCVSAGAAMRVRDPRAPFLFERILKPLLLRRIFDDMARMEEIVESSGLCWTIVRPQLLLNTKARGRYRVVQGFYVPKAIGISRVDLADFMVRQVESEAYIRKAVAIAY